MTDIICSRCKSSCREEISSVSAVISYYPSAGGPVCRRCWKEMNFPTAQTLNSLRDEIHNLAIEKGWWSAKEGDCFNRTPLEIHALIHTEVAEATEEVRNGKPDEYRGEDGKPEGEAVELIDVVVRVLDYFGTKGWDADRIMREKIDFNKTRDFRHGGKTK